MKIWIFNSYYEKYDDINDYGSDNITGITITIKLSANINTLIWHLHVSDPVIIHWSASEPTCL